MGHHHAHREDHADPFAQAAHGGHVLHAGEELPHTAPSLLSHGHAGRPPTAPGSGGPHDPEYWASEISDSEGLSEVIDAVRPGADAEGELASRVPAREPISSDSSEMLDHMRTQIDIPQAGTTVPTTARDELAELEAQHDAALAREATPAPPAASETVPHGPGFFDSVLGFLGVYGGTGQAIDGGEEFADGHHTLGLLDGTAGIANVATGAGTVLGEAALATPQAQLGAAALSSIAEGERINEEEGTFGEPGTSGAEFAWNAATSSGAGIYDSIVGDSTNPALRLLGEAAGFTGGALAGASTGMLALGGDLYEGVPAALGGLYNAVTRPGEEFVESTDVYGEPTRDASGHVHHVTAPEFVRASAGGAYDDVHDSIAGLAGPEHAHDAVGTAADVAGTVLGGIAGAGVGAGAGVIGLGGSIAGAAAHVGNAADHLWSWLTD